MNELLIVLLSVVPAIEAMWTSSYFFYTGQLGYVPLCIILNFLGVALFVKLLDIGLVPKRIESFLEKKRNKAMKRAESWFGRYGLVALFLLIGLPFTGIGSYTGAFIGRVFQLKGAYFYAMLFLAISFSVIFGFLIGTFFNIYFFKP
jgi:uncharacterized membrane protein